MKEPPLEAALLSCGRCIFQSGRGCSSARLKSLGQSISRLSCVAAGLAQASLHSDAPHCAGTCLESELFGISNIFFFNYSVLVWH